MTAPIPGPYTVDPAKADPDRIWLEPQRPNGSRDWRADDTPWEGAIEYVRADLVAAPVTEAEVERAVRVFESAAYGDVTGMIRAVLVDFLTTRIAERG